MLWDEAVKINGAVPDFHRRDLWEAINKGDFPEWELGLQVFDEEKAAALDFDVLDSTKLIRGEIIPLRMVGRMVLNRNADNFFAETEQVAFLPSNVPPDGGGNLPVVRKRRRNVGGRHDTATLFTARTGASLLTTAVVV